MRVSANIVRGPFPEASRVSLLARLPFSLILAVNALN